MMDIIEKARVYAADKHASQKRKYTAQSYVNHLEAVASTLQSAGVMEPTVLGAAYLHDTDATMQDIIREFGTDRAQLVYWLTDAEEGNRESRTLMSSWRLARAPMQAKLIKFADIIDNATNIRDRGFFRLWAAEKVDILKRMVEIEGSGLSEHALFERAWAATTV